MSDTDLIEALDDQIADLHHLIRRNERRLKRTKDEIGRKTIITSLHVQRQRLGGAMELRNILRWTDFHCQYVMIRHALRYRVGLMISVTTNPVFDMWLARHQRPFWKLAGWGVK